MPARAEEGMGAVGLGRGYEARRQSLLEYFDRTAAASWARLTSRAPVGYVRRTVREGRERMRNTLMAWLPGNLNGKRVLDAGCGTGTMAIELARRGADVVAIDISPTLVALARERARASALRGRVDFRVGDMLDPALGEFHHVVLMDSLIHYALDDYCAALERIASRARGSVLVTFAPGTPMLRAMHRVGRLFPRGDRSPAIEPIADATLLARLANDAAFGAVRPGRSARIARGFYTSHALELVRRPVTTPREAGERESTMPTTGA